MKSDACRLKWRPDLLRDCPCNSKIGRPSNYDRIRHRVRVYFVNDLFMSLIGWHWRAATAIGTTGYNTYFKSQDIAVIYTWIFYRDNLRRLLQWQPSNLATEGIWPRKGARSWKRKHADQVSLGPYGLSRRYILFMISIFYDSSGEFKAYSFIC